MSLTLHPAWKDIRGFLWAGMRCHVRYTYRGHLPNSGPKMFDKRVRLRPCEIKRGVIAERGKWVFDGRPMEPEWRVTRASTGDSEITVIEDHKTRYLWKANEGGTWHAELIADMMRLDNPLLHWSTVDLVGCNSPQRALFKRSFLLPLIPYYFVTTLDTKQVPEFWAPTVEAAVA